MNEARAGNDLLNEWVTAAGAEFVWSDALLKIVPYGEAEVSGNGVTCAPDPTPVYDLGPTDFVRSSPDDTSPLVRVTRKRLADVYNRVKVEYLDRSNAYNVAVAVAEGPQWGSCDVRVSEDGETYTLGGLTMVQDVNAALAGLSSFLQGPVAPSAAGLGLSNLVGVGWHDTTAAALKVRDQADTAWITIGAFDETNKVFRSALVQLADSSMRATATGIQANKPVASISANQTIAAVNHFGNFIATATLTLTLAQATTLWNGFAFAVTITDRPSCSPM